MKALVIVHLSSLDSYAERAGLDKAYELAKRMEKAILAWAGPVYIVDQRWSIDHWSDPRWKLVNEVQLKRDIQWIHFDDPREDWEIFQRQLRSRLLRDGVKEVVLGGVWYHPGAESGCVSEVKNTLKRNLRVKVDQELVGCWTAKTA